LWHEQGKKKGRRDRKNPLEKKTEGGGGGPKLKRRKRGGKRGKGQKNGE